MGKREERRRDRQGMKVCVRERRYEICNTVGNLVEQPCVAMDPNRSVEYRDLSITPRHYSMQQNIPAHLFSLPYHKSITIIPYDLIFCHIHHVRVISV